jgi:tetratricopeptide (TPR) repeat protein
MAELPQSIQLQIDTLAEKGNALLEEQENWQEAVKVWSQGLELLPKPSEMWEAYTWFQTSICEANWVGQDCPKSCEHFLLAKESDDRDNPFINFRVGTCLVELRQDGKAQEFLKAAYDEAPDLFEDEEKYLKLIDSSWA